MSYWDLLNQAITKFGATEQENLAIEECSELIQAISHKHRGREHNIAEEIADVEIMLDQLRIINDCFYEVANIKEIKLERLEERLRGETV